MKQILFYLLLSIIFQSCSDSDRIKDYYKDFQVTLPGNFIFNDSTFIDFISDYIQLKENMNRKVFTLYIDQRMDTLLFTIWRNPGKSINPENSFGYCTYDKKVIIIYSPYYKLFEKHILKRDLNSIEKLYDEEKEYYSSHKQELVMGQLKMPYHGAGFIIEKDFKRIFNTTKAPVPDSIDIYIGYQNN